MILSVSEAPIPIPTAAIMGCQVLVQQGRPTPVPLLSGITGAGTSQEESHRSARCLFRKCAPPKRFASAGGRGGPEKGAPTHAIEGQKSWTWGYRSRQHWWASHQWHSAQRIICFSAPSLRRYRVSLGYRPAGRRRMPDRQDRSTVWVCLSGAGRRGDGYPAHGWVGKEARDPWRFESLAKQCRVYGCATVRIESPRIA